MADRGCPLEAVPLPAEVRESLAELELELSEGERPPPGPGTPAGPHRGLAGPLTPRTPAMLLPPGPWPLAPAGFSGPARCRAREPCRDDRLCPSPGLYQGLLPAWAATCVSRPSPACLSFLPCKTGL